MSEIPHHEITHVLTQSGEYTETIDPHIPVDEKYGVFSGWVMKLIHAKSDWVDHILYQLYCCSKKFVVEIQSGLNVWNL